MIFEDFQLGILARLQGDAYFTQANLISLQKEVRRNIRKTVQESLNVRGIIGVVGLPRWEYARERTDFLFETAVEFFESPLLVETEDDDRTGFNCVAKGHALLNRYPIPVEFQGATVFPFSALQINFGGFAEEREGVPIYRLNISSRIYLENLLEVVGDEAGDILVTEGDEPLLISPTAT